MIGHLTDILEQLDIPADWIGIRASKEISSWRAMRDGKPQQNERGFDQGAMVEVLANGQFGYSATNQLTPESLRAAAQRAYEQAIATSQWAIHRFTQSVRPPVKGEYTSPYQQALDSLSVREINDLLRKLCDRLKVSTDIVRTSAVARTHNIESWFISSNGSEIYQKLMLLETHMGAIAQAPGVTQARTDNGYLAHSYQGGWEYFSPSAAHSERPIADPSRSDSDIWTRAARIGQQAIELLTAPDCPDTTTTLVLAPDQMMLQLHESVGHPIELDRILGDERNYAGGSFVQPKDFGTLTYGSALMNVTFDATHSGELASYRFDDTGTPAAKEYLIKDGILQRGLGGLESQARLQVPGVACARACSWNRPAIDRMANINLEPGETDFKRMISAIEDGVYMESNRSWSIDDQRHKFQFGCEYARKIENGKLTTPLKNPNYRATTPHFWKNLRQVGSIETLQTYGTPYCGKGEPNQLIRVGHASPTCAFENIEVFGGAN